MSTFTSTSLDMLEQTDGVTPAVIQRLRRRLYISTIEELLGHYVAQGRTVSRLAGVIAVDEGEMGRIMEAAMRLVPPETLAALQTPLPFDAMQGGAWKSEHHKEGDDEQQ